MALHARRKRYQCSFNLLPMFCLITYRRLAQGILLLHRYLLLYHPSVLPSNSMNFLFNVQNRKYTQALRCTVHKISFPTSLYLPKSDYFGDEIFPEISKRATLNVFSITPCTDLQTHWFLMRWNSNLMELLDVSFSSFVHL
jgi:hypothetical protein